MLLGDHQLATSTALTYPHGVVVLRLHRRPPLRVPRGHHRVENVTVLAFDLDVHATQARSLLRVCQHVRKGRPVPNSMSSC